MNPKIKPKIGPVKGLKRLYRAHQALDFFETVGTTLKTFWNSENVGDNLNMLGTT